MTLVFISVSSRIYLWCVQLHFMVRSHEVRRERETHRKIGAFSTTRNLWCVQPAPPNRPIPIVPLQADTARASDRRVCLTVIFVISVPENLHIKNISQFWNIEIFCPTPNSLLTNNVSYGIIKSITLFPT